MERVRTLISPQFKVSCSIAGVRRLPHRRRPAPWPVLSQRPGRAPVRARPQGPTARRSESGGWPTPALPARSRPVRRGWVGLLPQPVHATAGGDLALFRQPHGRRHPRPPPERRHDTPPLPREHRPHARPAKTQSSSPEGQQLLSLAFILGGLGVP
ncbi:hypothetical protein ACIQ7J_13270 [Streptomyces fagopyri]|uniref:hypothetical protein n=1 Tax=Streptomyces fagopyri TaxID=2662397 RepID=UPI0038270F51